MTAILHAAAVFLSAALLFMVQFMAAKAILPWFGGSADVWTTCMLFFQVALLLGYLYADRVVRLLEPRRRMMLHASLLAASLLLLPVLPGTAWRPAGPGSPVSRILALLGATLGVPFVLLSATSPLLQASLARGRQTGSVYRLFALSNAGSMVGLLAYPLVVEPWLALRTQDLLWSGAYALFAMLCILSLWLGSRLAAPSSGAPPLFPSSPRPPARRMLLWAGLAWCPSTLLLAVTNHVSQNLAAVPFLWMVPLALYLFSFVISFGRSSGYPRTISLLLAPPALAAMIFTLGHRYTPIVPLLGILWGGLFVCCLVCHGELARLRPPPDRLTGYYLVVSLGGAAGGLVAGLAAPLLLPGYFELHLALALWPPLAAAAILAGTGTAPAPRQRRLTVAVTIPVTFAAAVFLTLAVVRETRSVRFLGRSFYGGLKITDANLSDPAVALREMLHGGIEHGLQFLHPLRRMEPTAYFGPTSGIGLALSAHHPERSRRVGIIGLGAGTLAAYGRKGDLFRFYEINPLVTRLARTEFFFLAGSQADIEVVEGDGRLALESEKPQGFDILVMDAFSGDAVPTHLLTREAFELYRRHLAPDGLLAVNITNGYLDLAPVVRRSAEAIGRPAFLVTTPADTGRAALRSDWVLVPVNPGILASPLLHRRFRSIPRMPDRFAWRDDFSNLLAVLRR